MASARARISLRRLSQGSHLASGSLVTESTAHLGPSDNYGLLRSQPGNTEIRGLPRSSVPEWRMVSPPCSICLLSNREDPVDWLTRLWSRPGCSAYRGESLLAALGWLVPGPTCHTDVPPREFDGARGLLTGYGNQAFSRGIWLARASSGTLTNSTSNAVRSLRNRAWKYSMARPSSR